MWVGISFSLCVYNCVGDWEQAKQSFEELVAVESNESEDARMEVYRDYIYVLLQVSHSTIFNSVNRIVLILKFVLQSPHTRAISTRSRLKTVIAC